LFLYLGHPGVETEFKTLRLGSIQTQALVADVADVADTADTADTAVIDNSVFITSEGQVGVEVSWACYKQDIEPLDRLSEPVYQLCQVTFHYRHESQGARQ
jgi:hypothetical protein